MLAGKKTKLSASKFWEAISFCDIKKETYIKIIILGKISSDRNKHICLQKQIRSTVVEDGI